MASKDAKDDAPVDNRDALEVLESEAKEWEKVRSSTTATSTTPAVTNSAP
jgi:DnaJ family protein C protein 8